MLNILSYSYLCYSTRGRNHCTFLDRFSFHKESDDQDLQRASDITINEFKDQCKVIVCHHCLSRDDYRTGHNRTNQFLWRDSLEVKQDLLFINEPAARAREDMISVDSTLLAIAVSSIIGMAFVLAHSWYHNNIFTAVYTTQNFE